MSLDWLQQLPHFPLRKNNLNNNNNIRNAKTTTATKRTKTSAPSKRNQSNHPRTQGGQSQRQKLASLENRPSSAPPTTNPSTTYNHTTMNRPNSPPRATTPQPFGTLNHENNRPFDSSRKVSLSASQYQQARKSGQVKLKDQQTNNDGLTQRFQQMIQAVWDSFSSSHDDDAQETNMIREVTAFQPVTSTTTFKQQQQQPEECKQQQPQEEEDDQFLFQSYEDDNDDIFFTYSCFSGNDESMMPNSTQNQNKKKNKNKWSPFFKVSLPNCQYEKMATVATSCGAVGGGHHNNNSALLLRHTLSADQQEEKQQEHEMRAAQSQQQTPQHKNPLCGTGQGDFCGAFSLLFL